MVNDLEWIKDDGFPSRKVLWYAWSIFIHVDSCFELDIKLCSCSILFSPVIPQLYYFCFDVLPGQCYWKSTFGIRMMLFDKCIPFRDNAGLMESHSISLWSHAK